MLLTMNKKGNAVAMGIAVVTVIILAVILGSVENGITWTQTLTGTIGNYIEPLAILSALALCGYMAYSAFKR